MLSWIPTIITIVSLVGGGAIAYKQIGDNKVAIDTKVDAVAFKNHAESTRDARVRLAADISDLEENMDEAEDAIDELERSDLQSAGDIKLQLQQLSTQQKVDRDALERQLQLILQLLERQDAGN